VTRPLLAQAEQARQDLARASFIGLRAAAELAGEQVRDCKARIAELGLHRAVTERERARLQEQLDAAFAERKEALVDCYAEAYACAAVLGQLIGEAQGASLVLAAAEHELAWLEEEMTARFAGTRPALEAEYARRRATAAVRDVRCAVAREVADSERRLAQALAMALAQS